MDVYVVNLFMISFHTAIQELEDFMEGADEGVILFCLGISTEMTPMIERDLRPLFAVFGELGQRVIAKMSRAPTSYPVPANVLGTVHI